MFVFIACVDFCHYIHDTMSGSGSRTAERSTPQQLAAKASETMNLVQNILENNCESLTSNSH